jgi:energy-coupling factor transporter ATP-binding protein EcfA2
MSDIVNQESWVLRTVSLQIRQGECLALAVHNRSGKSIMLKILSRIIPPTGADRPCLIYGGDETKERSDISVLSWRAV